MFGLNHWGRQQSTCSFETTKIVDLIKDEVRFTDWPLRSRQILAAAIYPGDGLKDAHGGWTKEGRASLLLIQHMFESGSFIKVPAAIADSLKDLDTEVSMEIHAAASAVRQELPKLIPQWLPEPLFESA